MKGHADILAYVMLFGWPLISIFFFRRWPLPKAIVVTILGGYLFLPEEVSVNLPLIPAFDKASIPVVAALILAVFAGRAELRRERLASRRAAASVETSDDLAPAQRVRPRRPELLLSTKIVIVIGLILLVSPIATYLTNREFVRIGPTLLPGLRPYDIGNMALSLAVVLIPFWLGRKYFQTEAAVTMMLRSFVGMALIYSLLMLIEIRLSPQLNRWVYGFYAHSFAQHVRDGDFRPMVFLQHGLRVAIFIAISILAAAALSRAETDRKKRSRYVLITLWLFGVLAISSNLGALLITLLMLPVLLFAPLRMKWLFVGAISAFVLLYPVARGTGLAPTQLIYEAVYKINPNRANSWAYRTENEDILLARANEKPLAGWGRFGRNRVYNEKSGSDESTTDGTWIIMIGTYGWLGYLGRFGLLCMPLMIFGFFQRRLQPGYIDLALGFMLAANLLDLIPNSSLVPPTWLVAGALFGRFEAHMQGARERQRDSEAKRRARGARRATGRTTPELAESG